MLTPSQPASPAADPLVTMIVLCYNQARFVVETLESVKAQTYKNTELIIIDDCSSDDSVAMIERWLHENGIQCNFIPHPKNQGICKSLNEALALTTGKYISMIASDDIWLPDKIDRQVAIMESQPESVGVLYTDAFQIDEHGNPLLEMYIACYWKLSQMPQGQILDTLLESNIIPGPTTLIRRSCYDKVGLYDENLPWEDWDMWMRMARHYSFIYSPMPAGRYRVHAKSLWHCNPERMAKDSFTICLKQFAIGDLNSDQKSKLTGTLLNLAQGLYSRNDADAPSILLTLWQTTGNKRARWMYRFARLGVSFRTLQRANACRKRLRRFVGKLLNLINSHGRKRYDAA
ncbi:MAG: glycosyltransferase [Candidatus Acidiferrales bacterium]